MLNGTIPPFHSLTPPSTSPSCPERLRNLHVRSCICGDDEEREWFNSPLSLFTCPIHKSNYLVLPPTSSGQPGAREGAKGAPQEGPEGRRVRHAPCHTAVSRGSLCLLLPRHLRPGWLLLVFPTFSSFSSLRGSAHQVNAVLDPVLPGTFPHVLSTEISKSTSFRSSLTLS